MPATGKHVLIFGASGISGWSLMNQSLSYPTSSTFSRITGLCNRPLTKKDAWLPDDPRLNIVPGIDLTASVETVTEQLKDKVHEAISTVAPNLEVVILQTGGKGYGLEFPDKVNIQPPLYENMPRIPEPWRSNIFYYDQYDLLMELSKGSKWTFSEIRPDGIVGFVPGTNAMNMAHGIAFYLTLYREVYGRGASVPFPGKPHGYRSTHSDTFQDILSKMEIFAALHRDLCPNGSEFNAADGETVTWEQVWPGICSYFGLVGTEPREGQQTSMEGFVSKHRETWDLLRERYSLKKGVVEQQNWTHTQFMLVEFDFNREYSLEKARSVGFTESIDTVKGYHIAFDRMVQAGLIPSGHS
ncbi:hypothetical protein BBP40_009088 [Aspergillus hancockii]|nr:hypothetical protein BBP40_009088 [Aspergillus hancockii]